MADDGKHGRQQQRRGLEHLSAADLAPLERSFADDYPERLREMARVIFMELNAQDLSRPTHELAIEITEAVSAEIGGSSFYMHKGHAYRLKQRDRQIAAEFNGQNLHLLARKYNRTEMRIRQILDACNRERVERDQGKLGFDS